MAELPYLVNTEPNTKYSHGQDCPAENYSTIPIATAIPTGPVTGSTVAQLEGASGEATGEDPKRFSYSFDKTGQKIDCVVVSPPPVLQSDHELVNDFKRQLAQAGQDALNEIPVAEPVIGTEEFFTKQEMNVLDALPVDPNNKFQQPKQGSQTYAVQPTNAIPIIPNAYTTARVSSDWLHSGIKTRDLEVASSKEEIYAFLNAHNTAPQVVLYIEGYRMITTVNSTNGKSNQRKVTDFRYGIDISQFVYPYGKIVSKECKLTTEEYMERFVCDRNKLKAIRMKKVIIGFDFSFLQSQIRAYIRALGYRHRIQVTTHTRNKSVRIVSKSRLASFWDNPAARVFCWATLIPGLTMTAYGSGHRDNHLYSHFIMVASPVQIFAAIRPRIWVSGVYRGCAIT